MKLDTEKAVAELREITDDLRNAFGSLRPEQLNWKPSETGWSVGQCVDHLIRSNIEMFPTLDQAAAGKVPTFWEKYSPLTGWIGGFMARSLSSDKRKFKAPSNNIVPPSDISAGVVEMFAANQAMLVEKLRAMSSIDADRTVVTSPFMKLMTYKLSDGFRIVVEHEKRHIRQARRVTEMAGFPR